MRVSRKAEVSTGGLEGRGGGAESVGGGKPMPGANAVGAAQSEPFVEKLFSKLLSEVRGTIDTLQHRVDEAAGNLVNQPNQVTLDGYKDAVSHLLAFVIGNSFKILHLQSYKKGKDGQPKPLVKVEIIDQKMAELTRDVITGQKPFLNLVNRLDEIRGLLMDLYDWKPGP